MVSSQSKGSTESKPTWSTRLRKPAPEDMPTVAFMIATVVLVVSGAITSNPVLEFAGLTPLIIAMAWNMLSDKQALHDRMDDDRNQLQHTLEQMRRAIGVGVHVLDHGVDTYAHAQKILREARDRGGWESVRLYAPIGLWSHSATKEAWIDALANEMGESVQTLSVVATLPSDSDVFKTISVPMLNKFAATPGTEMYYIPPTHSEQLRIAPDFGVAVFADRDRGEYRAVLAFLGRPAGTSRATLTNTIVLDGEPANRILIDWFDNSLVKNCIGNVLLGADRTNRARDITLDEHITNIIAKHYR